MRRFLYLSRACYSERVIQYKITELYFSISFQSSNFYRFVDVRILWQSCREYTQPPLFVTFVALAVQISLSSPKFQLFRQYDPTCLFTNVYPDRSLDFYRCGDDDDADWHGERKHCLQQLPRRYASLHLPFFPINPNVNPVELLLELCQNNRKEEKRFSKHLWGNT